MDVKFKQRKDNSTPKTQSLDQKNIPIQTYNPTYDMNITPHVTRFPEISFEIETSTNQILGMKLIIRNLPAVMTASHLMAFFLFAPFLNPKTYLTSIAQPGQQWVTEANYLRNSDGSIALDKPILNTLLPSHSRPIDSYLYHHSNQLPEIIPTPIRWISFEQSTNLNTQSKAWILLSDVRLLERERLPEY